MKRLVESGEEGFILVFTLLLMVVLMLLGVSAIDTSIFESTMSVNDALYKQVFYEADGGTEVGLKLTFDNAICVQANDGFNEDDLGTGKRTINNIVVSDLEFSSPQNLTSVEVSDSNRHAAYYSDGDISDAAPHTNLLIDGEVKYSPGSGLQMVSGYEGLGASSAASSHTVYTIYSQHKGARQTETLVTLVWKLSTQLINNASSYDCDDVLYKN